MSDQVTSIATVVAVMDDFVVDQLTVLLQQQDNYQCPDYMSPDYRQTDVLQKIPTQLQFVQECAAIFTDSSLSKVVTPTTPHFHPSPTDVRRVDQSTPLQHHDSPPVPRASDVDHLALWRTQMCSWAYAVVDTFGHNRTIVAVAFNFLDRYLASLQNTNAMSRKDFQLVTMTCLYMTIKLMEPYKLSIATMTDMSRGYFTTEDFEVAELELLEALEWRLNPPTAAAICQLMIGETDAEWMAMCQTRCEEVVLDPFYVPHKASAIALAVMMTLANDRNESMMTELSQGILAPHIASPEFLAVYQHMQQTFINHIQ